MNVPGLGRSPDLLFEHALQRDLALQRFVDIATIHADDALAGPERGEALGGEAVEADEEAAGPRRLLVELTVEDVEIGGRRQRRLPLRLEQVDLVAENEAAVDLLAGVAEGFPRSEAGGVEGALQERLEGVAALMGRKIADVEQFGLQRCEQPRWEPDGRRCAPRWDRRLVGRARANPGR